MASVRDRILASVAVNENGCWIWKRAVQSSGYGSIGIDGTGRLAHRVAYVQWKGEIPDDYQVDHLCKVRLCVNPEHLEAVPGHVNNDRSDSGSAINARRTHCKSGHPFDLINTYVKPNGKRQCRKCQTAMTQRWRERVRDAATT